MSTPPAGPASLVRQLLAFSRRQHTEPKVLDLNNLILGVDKMLRRLIGENIALACRLDADTGTVRADPGQVEQMLINMAINASDAMPAGGELTLQTSSVELGEGSARQIGDISPGRYARLSISDTGSGMDDEVRSHVFEPFFTTKGPGKGTGLGLSTCHGIVKQSGGEITVRSDPGRGTTFDVYLPVVTDTTGEAVMPDLSGDLPTGTETVLVAEDEPSVRRLAAQVLRRQGYTVLEASDGEKALQLARADGVGKIQLVLADVAMPRMGGKELATALGDTFPRIKVLFTTGYTDEVLTQPEPREGGRGWIQKPFTPVDLTRKRERGTGHALGEAPDQPHTRPSTAARSCRASPIRCWRPASLPV